jgi:pyruvate kinase
MRRTKIVATLGPASSNEEMLGKMIDAGLDMARLNCSHGSVEEHAARVKLVRETAAEKGRNVAVLTDLPGPKIRTTTMGDGIQFDDGDVIELRSGSEPSVAGRIFSDYPTLSEDLVAGDHVTLGDGGVDLRVERVEGDTVFVKVMNGGHLQSRPGLHLPADRITLPVPTDEDRMLIEKLSIPQDVDYVAVSFVRTADEINEVRKLLGDSGIRIIAKIETPHALENLDEIVAASDAVMVARGDLGTECPFEDVPVYQKRIIRTCLANAKPVITATQMMESMITASTPTRAEASDVANAVCDGTDAIMLSGETAIGHNPALVVQAMAKIADAAEIVADFDRFALTLSPDRQLNEITVALTHGAWWAMNDLGVKAVLCCTRSGSTAHAMAALRPEAKLIALSTSAQTVRQEALTWGVESLGLPETTDSDSMVAAAAERAKEAGLVQAGDLVGILSGGRDVPGATNDFRLITIA